MNDGCTGLAVLNPGIPQEVQFDEHKLLIVYGDQLDPYEDVMRHRSVDCDEELKFITEAEHVHSSSDHYAQQFDELKTRLGMDCGYMYGVAARSAAPRSRFLTGAVRIVQDCPLSAACCSLFAH